MNMCMGFLDQGRVWLHGGFSLTMVSPGHDVGMPLADCRYIYIFL